MRCRSITCTASSSPAIARCFPARACCGSPKFDAGEVRALLPRATVMMGVPTFYTRLLARADVRRATTAASMRLFVSGSAPLLPETFDAVPRAHRAHDPRALRHDRDRHEHVESARRRAHRRHRRAAAAGRGGARRRRRRRGRARRAKSAASRSRARTCSPATGACRRRRARSSPPTAISAPATSASSLPNGYLRIVGRAKDLIITGGLNVYPKEIEERIDALPGVVESAVIGVPDADFGEAVAAVVVAQARATR